MTYIQKVTVDIHKYQWIIKLFKRKRKRVVPHHSIGAVRGASRSAYAPRIVADSGTKDDCGAKDGCGVLHYVAFMVLIVIYISIYLKTNIYIYIHIDIHIYT